MSRKHRILVCGSRSYSNEGRIYEVLDAYRARLGPKMFLIVGGAPGADELARQWAVDRKVDHLVSYARWATEPRVTAGPSRNRRQFKRGRPGLCLAFHTDPKLGRGTADMVAVCLDGGVRVKRFIDSPQS